MAPAYADRASDTTAFESAVAVAPTTVVTLHQDPTARRVADDPGANGNGTVPARDNASAGAAVSSAAVSSNGEADVQSAESSDNGDDGSGDRHKINWHRKYCDKTRDELVDNAVEAEEALEGMCDPGSFDELPGVPDGVEVVAATPCRGWANIFNADGTTVYFFYVDVLLSQDGITSARTLETPMTLEADGWTPSDIGIQTDGLAFVQSVEF